MLMIAQNFILFQIGWLCCVLGGASADYTGADYSWAGVIAVVMIVTLHLYGAKHRVPELSLIVIATLIGTVWDSALMINGLYEFSNGVVVSVMVPFWLIAIWALFATTLNVSMNWLKGRYLLSAVFGAIGGPLAYYAGHRLGAVEFNDVYISLVVVSAGWAVIMPVLVALSNVFNGYRDSSLNEQEGVTV